MKSVSKSTTLSLRPNSRNGGLVVSLRLGEVLVQKGLLDEARLKRALDAQLIYGGHLGTCLVELGLIDVDVLSQVLAETFHVGGADRENILRIAPEAVAALPRKLVEKHVAIPFKLKDNVLHVALLDPRNLKALDELSFASGRNVEAWIAPEILIRRAMEHYYQVPRKLRHIVLSPAAPNPYQGPPQASALPREEEASPESPPRVEQPVDCEGFVAESNPSARLTEDRVSESRPTQRGNEALHVEWFKLRRADAESW